MLKGRFGEIYNFTSNEYVTIAWLVRKICSLTSTNFNKLVKVTKDRPTKDFAYKMNSKKAEKEFSWRARYKIEDGLKKTIKWYELNKKILSKLNNAYVHKV